MWRKIVLSEGGSLEFFKTGPTEENFQQTGKKEIAQSLQKTGASSGTHFFRTIAGVPLHTVAFSESSLKMMSKTSRASVLSWENQIWLFQMSVQLEKHFRSMYSTLSAVDVSTLNRLKRGINRYIIFFTLIKHFDFYIFLLYAGLQLLRAMFDTDRTD